jgi:hypothetical protein
MPQNKTGDGLLILNFSNLKNNDASMDKSIYDRYLSGVQYVEVSTVSNITNMIRRTRPEVLHLLAKFNEQGLLLGNDGESWGIDYLMKFCDEEGVRLLIIGTENQFSYIKDEIYDAKNLDLLVITKRNKHYPTFLEGLIVGMAKTGSLAKAYVNLAPQHEMAQKGLALPGSIAICPGKNGSSLMLWSEAQD